MTSALRDWIGDRRNAGSLLLLITLLVHLPGVLSGAFHFDDSHHIQQNPALRDPGNALLFFVDATLWSGEEGNAMYRPVLMLTYLPDYLLWGYRPAGWLITNCLLHAAVAVLVWRLALRLGIGPPAALAAGTVMAVHPVFSEVVNYVSSRSESVAALLMLGALLLHMRSTESSGGRRAGLVACAAALAALSTMSKETTAGFCAAVGLLELVRTTGTFGARLRRAMWLAAPYAAALGVVFVLRGMALEHAVADVKIFSTHAGADPQIGGGRPVVDNLLTQSRVVVLYLQLLAFPVRLNVDHDVSLVLRSASPGLATWFTVALSGLFHLVVVGAAVAAFRRGKRLFPLCVGWFWIFLAPSVVIPLNVVMNEHRLYLPGIAVSIAAGAALTRLATRLVDVPASPRVWVAACAAPALLIPFMDVPDTIGGPVVLLCVATLLAASLLLARGARSGSAFVFAPVLLLVPLALHRSLEWQSDEQLWRRAVERSPESARAHMHLGAAVRNKANTVGRLERVRLIRAAIGHYEESEARHADWVDVHLNLAEAHLSLGRETADLEAFRTARAHARRICDILEYDAARALMLEVQALVGLERYEEAEEVVARLRREDASETPLYDLMLSTVLREKGDVEGAREVMERAIAIADPDRALDARCRLAWWWFEDGLEPGLDPVARRARLEKAEALLTQAKEIADSDAGEGLTRRYLPFLYIARFLVLVGEPGFESFYEGALARGWRGRMEEQIWVRGGPTPGLAQARLGTLAYQQRVQQVEIWLEDERQKDAR